MKCLNLLSLFAAITLSLTAVAQNNPQIRQCHITGGEFLVAQTENDQIGLCKYDSALIGTIDLLTYEDNLNPVQSLQTYIDGIQSCEPYAQTKTIQILDGTSIDVCVFFDGSTIDSNTLKLGRHAPENTKLNKALDL